MSRLVVKATEGGFGLVTAERSGAFEFRWFDRAAWEARGARRHTSTGRAPVLICEMPTESWVLRHYSRGGLVARLVEDHYVWRGLEATRAWRELDILKRLQAWQLPAPQPVAALVSRSALAYQADIITVYIPDTQTLSALARSDPAPQRLWMRIGEMLGAFHARGVDHPDITAHNILVDSQERTYLVDFDNAVIRPRGNWQRRGIARFQRSLRKVAMETGGAFSPAEWQAVIAGYESSVT
ncbi:MAG: 3-deoxy-D-manno-octulosonic acid kinase [Gammaproteobacteria bacterium]|jgi:3-deoxy-D-manno-octulosonic acid kinase